MTDLPIIFSAPMVRALLDGRKTMTRRLAWRENPPKMDRGVRYVHTSASPWQRVKPGDRLWVREKLQYFGEPGGLAHLMHQPLHWAADEVEPGFPGPGVPNIPEDFRLPNRKNGEFIPSIHMPRWASRLTLVVTATKIERLQDISAEDAVAEGLIKLPATGRYVVGKGDQYFGLAHRDPRLVFCSLWSELHGEASWDANPEVVALSFEVHRANIDALSTEGSQS